MRAQIITAIGVATLTVAALTACTDGEDSPSVVGTNPDGTTVVDSANGDIDLFSTPDISEVPQWSVDTASLPNGWTQDESEAPGEGETPDPDVVAQNPPVVTNSDGSCFAQAGVIFLPSFQAGRGDLFLTKDYLFQNADMTFSPIEDQETLELKTTTGTVALYAGYYSSPTPQFDDQGQYVGEVDNRAWTAIRVIDKLFPNGITEEMLSTSGLTGAGGQPVPYDQTVGVPGASISVRCTTPEALDKVDVHALSGAFSLILK